jgi:spermine/spermidine synthase
MTKGSLSDSQVSTPTLLAGISATSAALLMTELALTRIFSVTMFYHFAFLAISIALFGLSASGVFVYVRRDRLSGTRTPDLLCAGALLHAVATLVGLALLVRIQVGLYDSPENVLRLLVIYVLAALPFFAGGAVISLAFARLTDRINMLYGADLLGAAAGCLALVPLLNQFGAPGVVIGAAALSAAAAVCFASDSQRRWIAYAAVLLVGVPAALQVSKLAPFDVVYAKGAEQGRLLFSKWNSFSRVAVYNESQPEVSVSPKFTGHGLQSMRMDIDASAATPILRGAVNPADTAYLRHDLTSIAYHLAEKRGDFTALVIGPGGGRDLLSALQFGARRVDGVEINPIIVKDVMLGRFRSYSGGIYADPRVSIHIEDGRSFVRRSAARFDVIQASLVDTWAATAAGAYTLTENSLYTTEAFGDYLDHLSENGVLTITRWTSDGLRLVSLAQEACARRGLDAAQHLAVIQLRSLITFILKRSPFTDEDARQLQRLADNLGFTVLYAPGAAPPPKTGELPEMLRRGMSVDDYRGLILAGDRERFLADYPWDIEATTDDRPFYFHTTRLRDLLRAGPEALGYPGAGLSTLLMLFAISALLVLLFIIGPLLVRGGRPGRGWGAWLAYFGALGAGFMLLEVALLQRFVLLLGHPVYSLTVTLFSLLLGTGLGSLVGRRIRIERVRLLTVRALVAAAIAAVLAALFVARIVDLAMPWPLAARIAVAAAILIPFGVLLGFGLPGGMRLIDRIRPEIVAWAWGINGALSVVGATLAIFIAMNWGFTVTLSIAAVVYVLAAATLASRPAA